MFHELYSVSLLLCIAQNVRFEIPYKVLYFETPFLIIFKYYAWVSCDVNSHACELCSCILIDVLSLLWRGQAVVTVVFEAFTMYLVLYKHFFRVTFAQSLKKYKSKPCHVVCMKEAIFALSRNCQSSTKPFSFVLPTLTFLIHFQI